LAKTKHNAELVGGPFDGEYFTWSAKQRLIRKARCGLLPIFTCKNTPAEPEIAYYEYMYIGQSKETGRHLFLLDRISE